MKYAWFVIAILTARFAVTAVDFPVGDGDLAWQGWLGQTILQTHRIPRALGPDAFSAAGAPWTPQEWLFGIGVALSHGGPAWPFFALAVAGCAIAAVVLVAYRAARRGAAPVAVAAVTTATGLAMFESFGVRAQVVAWPLLALALLVLDNEGPWLWALVPLAALWSNLHASAMLAPLLAGAAALGRLLEDRSWTPRVRRTFAVSAAAALAICCNPFGIGLPAYAIMLFNSPIKHYISEWEPTNVSASSFAYGSLPLLFFALALGIAARHRITDAIVFGAFAFLLFTAARNIAIFAIAVAPLVAVAMTEVFRLQLEDTRRSRADRIASYALPTLAALLAVFVGVGLYHSEERAKVTMPFREFATLEKLPGEHRVFCADFAWCSFLVGVPHQRVFLDGRADPYPAAVWEDFITIAFLRPLWQERLSGYDIDSVITERGGPLDQALALTRNWREGEHDVRFRLWIRTGPAKVRLYLGRDSAARSGVTGG